MRYRIILRSLRHWALAASALIALAAAETAAQTIAGRAIDGLSRLPLRGITVTLIRDSAQHISQTTTDTTGVFYANAVEAGIYRVRFSVDSTTSFESLPIQLTADGYVEREFVVHVPRVYLKSEVTRQVQMASGSRPPKYPAALRGRGTEGKVIAEFIVDTTGRVRLGSFKVIGTTHVEFADAVRDAIYFMRFDPAELNGQKVSQRVQEPFTFGIAR